MEKKAETNLEQVYTLLEISLWSYDEVAYFTRTLAFDICRKIGSDSSRQPAKNLHCKKDFTHL